MKKNTIIQIIDMDVYYRCSVCDDESNNEDYLKENCSCKLNKK